MKQFGQSIGSKLEGGEVIELIGDIGTGKTTFTKGLAVGLEIDEPVQSPTFTISRVYSARDNLSLCHYDFYRLGDAGIMAEDINESIQDKNTVTVVEWSDAVSDVLPVDRLQIYIQTTKEDQRQLTFKAGGKASQKILGDLK